MKQRFKLALDVIMLLMMLTFFNKQLISMQYHEIAGLVCIALVVIHIGINLKTVTAMCKKFMKVPLAIKTGLIVDILLLLCFICIGVSGVLISHTILTGISSTNMIFKMLHMFAGGLSVILLGVHIGLHICRRPLPVPAAAIASAIILCLGIYGITASSELRWLSMPFMTASQPGAGNHNNFNGKGPDQPDNRNGKELDDLPDNRNGNGPVAHNSDENTNSSTQQDGKFAEEHGSHEPPENGKGNGNRNGNFKQKPSLSMFQKLQSIAMFLGMILSCSVITYWIAIPKKKKSAA